VCLSVPRTHIFIAFSLFIKIVFTLMITVRRPGVPFLFSLLAGWYETVSVFDDLRMPSTVYVM
jgi:hypothetical protein